MDENTRAVLDRVGVELERVEAVLERIFGTDGAPGQLSRLARGDEAAVEPVGERGAQDKTPRFGAEDEIRVPRLRELGQLLHRLVQRVGVGEERHDVLEDDPALREVRDVSDLRREVVRHLALRDRAEGAPEQQVRQLLRERRESLQILEAGVAALGIA